MIKTRGALTIISGFLFSTNPLLAKDVIVDIYKRKFIPSDITIDLGDRLVWKNIEKRQYHNVWFKGSGEEEPAYLFPDESYQRKFNTLGCFSYECGPHPKMTGQVNVIKLAQ